MFVESAVLMQLPVKRCIFSPSWDIKRRAQNVHTKFSFPPQVSVHIKTSYTNQGTLSAEAVRSASVMTSVSTASREWIIHFQVIFN